MRFVSSLILVVDGKDIVVSGISGEKFKWHFK